MGGLPRGPPSLGQGGVFPRGADLVVPPMEGSRLGRAVLSLDEEGYCVNLKTDTPNNDKDNKNDRKPDPLGRGGGFPMGTDLAVLPDLVVLPMEGSLNGLELPIIITLCCSFNESSI